MGGLPGNISTTTSKNRGTIATASRRAAEAYAIVLKLKQIDITGLATSFFGKNAAPESRDRAFPILDRP
jgi:hypothetical protein